MHVCILHLLRTNVTQMGWKKPYLWIVVVGAPNGFTLFSHGTIETCVLCHHYTCWILLFLFFHRCAALRKLPFAHFACQPSRLQLHNLSPHQIFFMPNTLNSLPRWTHNQGRGVQIEIFVYFSFTPLPVKNLTLASQPAKNLKVYHSKFRRVFNQHHVVVYKLNVQKIFQQIRQMSNS